MAMIPNAWTGFDFGLGEDLDQLRQSVSGFSGYWRLRASNKVASCNAQIVLTHFPAGFVALASFFLKGFAIGDNRFL